MSNAYGLPEFDVDPYAPNLLRAPAAYYRELRAHGPLVFMPRYGVCASGHIAVVEAVFRDWRRFSSARGVGLADFKRDPPWRAPSIILEVDPPAHDRARRVMTRVLSPQAIRAAGAVRAGSAAAGGRSARASSLSDLGNRRETVEKGGQICALSRRKLRLFNEDARRYGPLSRRRSRFVLSPTGC